ncbi:sensor histidine kinase [Brevirhabdus sp.]|uniref:sensor histidine kinase n=1 Tax=Brevirhabdus sp. TaxID=2004514 RepID=UPI0040587263
MSALTEMNVTEDKDIVRVRQVGQQLTRALGFRSYGQTRVVTAWLELARNAMQHGGGGRIGFSLYQAQNRVGLRAVVNDRGPGIEAVERLLKNPHQAEPVSSERGLGLGLKGVHRMADLFEIDTGPKGTEVTAGFLSSLPAAELPSAERQARQAVRSLERDNPAAALARQNQDLMKALADRDLLIEEIHHRTRNNLALVNGLVRLSRMSATEQETKSVLTDLEGRINAIVKVHEQLQRSDEGDKLPILPLIRDVVDHTKKAFSNPSLVLSTTVEGDDLYLTSGAAIDVGLVVGELMTNAMKHAYADRKSGAFFVSFRRGEDNCLFLVVEDDGVGLPDGTDRPERSSSLGWRMIRSMTEKHGGSITVISNPGLRVTIRLSDRLVVTV